MGLPCPPRSVTDSQTHGTRQTSSCTAGLRDASTQQLGRMVIEASSADFQMCSDGVETSWCGTSMDHGVLAVGPDTGSRLKSGWRLRGVRGVTTRTRREFEFFSQVADMSTASNKKSFKTMDSASLHQRPLSRRREELLPLLHEPPQMERNMALPRRHLSRNIDILSTTLTALVRQ